MRRQTEIKVDCGGANGRRHNTIHGGLQVHELGVVRLHRRRLTMVVPLFMAVAAETRCFPARMQFGHGGGVSAVPAAK
ncbi:hypothetical protein TanjilG_07303 [Lupinus angustifolius]|uniref:Uncharacterized protein n=1 Tax=Lupinus angustifolius TaxID=3871 RepID=A0A4P1RJA5_LUPAN|nr:hypothetical protein TanjilG_07303 [Lupinus angustifolius]